ncbi:uncharacterized protein At4g22758 [Elaeis guineensis]|uniref:Uncharacterized protein At4g22758 n=1 Tax=Elaeis guineensis var. tenera TaxID=51953 RepID=A0A6I9RZK1_ELAGV|nr:uncharacterized protein At4g22758 [Elaeis guineensis]
MSSRDPAAGRRSASCHGLAPGRLALIQRPQSHQELPRRPEVNGAVGQRLTKLLLNVTIERSLGPVHVVMPPENTVADLVREAVEAYVKEGRRPLLPRTDPKAFDLHYSQYSLESLNPEEKLINLGSRNFFLCSKPAKVAPGWLNDRAKEMPVAAVTSR